MNKKVNTNIAFDTMNALDLFDIADPLDMKTIVLHIPHSSTYIPSKSGYVSDAVMEKEVELLTDHYCDKIFNLNDDITRIVAPFSRVFCDVERLPDAQEEMFKYGRGFFYTNTDAGNVLRAVIYDNKGFIYRNYYLPYHEKLTNEINAKLVLHGKAIIIDCHTFTDIPFNSDADKTVRPDICIGTDDFHTPPQLLKCFKDKFEALGYSVKVNSPYSGTMIPTFFYQRNKSVQGIMIEINRKLYLSNDHNETMDNVQHLNDVICNMFNL